MDEILFVDDIQVEGDDIVLIGAYNQEVEEGDIALLMTEMRSRQYVAANSFDRPPVAEAFWICVDLFKKDYDIEMLDNNGGFLCMSYPENIIIPAAKKDSGSSRTLDMAAYTQLVKDSYLSRCRTRFVVPVILFDNKFICRSGTLSIRLGQFYETALKPEPPRDVVVNETLLGSFFTTISNWTTYTFNKVSSGLEAAWNLLDSNKVEEVRKLDYEVMKTLNLEYTCDLMIEYAKVWYPITVSSSEKEDRGTYKNVIDIMPYPGCEFFELYHSAGRNAKDLVFNWDDPACTAKLNISNSSCAELKNIDWAKYETWDLITLTKNYIKVFLSRLIRGEGGILIHCISGWDRTPLMISLLRMSLWADGAIHQNLSMMEMAYLTLAYDWFMFGHNLPTRLNRKEEILHYCFNFLPHIATDEFSVTKMFEELPEQEKHQRDLPSFTPGRRTVLCDLSYLVLKFYKKIIERTEHR